jgi:peptide maturation system acyl carrier-related protein
MINYIIDGTKIDIELSLKEIFFNRFGINFNDVNLMNEHLLGNKISLAPRDLLYLLRDIEDTYSIEFPVVYIVDGKFSSFNNICEIISDIRNQ